MMMGWVIFSEETGSTRAIACVRQGRGHFPLRRAASPPIGHPGPLHDTQIVVFRAFGLESYRLAGIPHRPPADRFAALQLQFDRQRIVLAFFQEVCKPLAVSLSPTRHFLHRDTEV